MSMSACHDPPRVSRRKPPAAPPRSPTGACGSRRPAMGAADHRRSQIMAIFSDAQLVVLSAACQRPDRCVFPVTAKLKGNAAGNVLKSLLNKGLLKEVRAKRDDTVWRHDKKHGRMTLNATRAAFAAL